MSLGNGSQAGARGSGVLGPFLYRQGSHRDKGGPHRAVPAAPQGRGLPGGDGAPGAMLPSPSWCLREAARAANGGDARASLAELRTRHSSSSACGSVSREKFGVLGELMLGGVPGGG